MKLSLGPPQYFWPRERALAFYREAVRWPLDIIYLGETVCSKRRELGTGDWIALAQELADSGKQIVLSSLALIEAESELGALAAQCLDRRIPDKKTITDEVAAWVRERNKNHAGAEWHFSTDDARIKLRSLYPST